MKTIIFGNGLNLLNGYSTWNSLLKKIDDSKDIARIPNTLQFEAEVLSLPERELVDFTYYGKSITYNGKQHTYSIDSEKRLKADIAKEMESYRGNDLYSRIASMVDISHYVTTNYDDVMLRTLIQKGFTEYEHNKIENTYSLRRRVSLESGKSRKHIWNIHGEISTPQTIMLGLHQYCGSVGRITEYLNGKYSYSVDKEQKIVPSIKERLDGLTRGDDFPFAWVDLFFISDIIIIGFSLLYEEIDLWWILTRRKRLMRQGEAIKNHIYFCGPVDPGKQKLLETMSVEIIEPSPKADSYEEKYNSALDKLGWK